MMKMNNPKTYPLLLHTHCLCTKCARDIARRNYRSFKDQEQHQHQGESMEQAPLPQCYCSGGESNPHQRNCRTCAQCASSSRTPEEAKLVPFGCEFFILRQDEENEEE